MKNINNPQKKLKISISSDTSQKDLNEGPSIEELELFMVEQGLEPEQAILTTQEEGTLNLLSPATAQPIFNLGSSCNTGMVTHIRSKAFDEERDDVVYTTGVRFPELYMNAALKKISPINPTIEGYLAKIDQDLSFYTNQYNQEIILAAKRKAPHYGLLLYKRDFLRCVHRNVIPFSDSKDENNEKICLEILQSSLLFSTIATLKKKVESIVEAKDIVEFVTVKFYWGQSSGSLDTYSPVTAEIMFVLRKVITFELRHKFFDKFDLKNDDFTFRETLTIKGVAKELKADKKGDQFSKDLFQSTWHLETTPYQQRDSKEGPQWYNYLSDKCVNSFTKSENYFALRKHHALPRFRYMMGTYPIPASGINNIALTILRLYAVQTQYKMSVSSSFETYLSIPWRKDLDSDITPILKKKENLDLAKQVKVVEKEEEFNVEQLSTYDDFMNLPKKIEDNLVNLVEKTKTEMMRPDHFLRNMASKLDMWPSTLKEARDLVLLFIEELADEDSEMKFIDPLVFLIILADQEKNKFEVTKNLIDQLTEDGLTRVGKIEDLSAIQVCEILHFFIMFGERTVVPQLLGDMPDSQLQTFTVLMQIYVLRAQAYKYLYSFTQQLAQVTITNSGQTRFEKGGLGDFFRKVFDPSFQKACILVNTGFTNAGKTFSVKNIQRLLLQLNGAVIGSQIDSGFVRVDNLGHRFLKVVEEYKGNLVSSFHHLESNGKQLCKNNAIIDARINLTILNCDQATYDLEEQARQLLGKRNKSEDDAIFDNKNVKSRVNQVKSRLFVITWESKQWSWFAKMSKALCDYDKKIAQQSRHIFKTTRSFEEAKVDSEGNEIYQLWNNSVSSDHVCGTTWGTFLCEHAGWGVLLQTIMSAIVVHQSQPVMYEEVESAYRSFEFAHEEDPIPYEKLVVSRLMNFDTFEEENV